MEAEFEKKYHDVEQQHWWFRSRRNFILSLLADVDRNAKILDIGCSSGILLHDLAAAGFSKDNLFGVDISQPAIANCHAAGLENTFVMDAQQISIPQKFDIIIASDCLEHLENDRAALSNWRSLLAENGKALIFVPAFQSLWSNHDIVNMHFRRYTEGELTRKINEAGFSIRRSGYWNFFLFAPVYLFRKLSNALKLKSGSDGDISLSSAPVNKVLTKLLLVENKILHRVRLPVGVSTYCIATK